MNLYAHGNHGLSTLVAPGTGADLPAHIQWMPPGQQAAYINPGEDWSEELQARIRDEGFRVEVTEALARTVDEQLQAMIARAQAGEGDLPFIDFNHEGGAAAGNPTRAWWGGNDPKTGGIRLDITWTGAGKRALEGKDFRRFSPAWLFNPDSLSVEGVDVNMGGLVNHAGFRTIQAVVAKYGGATETKTMTEEEKKALTDAVAAAVAAALKPLDERLKSIEATASAGAGGDTSAAAKAVVLETKVAGLEASEKQRRTAEARGHVDAAVKAGKIPAQNKELQDRWVGLIEADAGHLKLLQDIAPNPALAGGVTGGSSGTAAAAGAQHAFIAKAAEFATAAGIKDTAAAQTQFAATAAGRELYQDYLNTMRATR